MRIDLRGRYAALRQALVLAIAIFLTNFCLSASAHNRVVVVPLGGEEPESFPPPSPVAKVAPTQDDYIISANTVIDKITGLEWQRGDNGGEDDTTNFAGAQTYCIDLELDGHDDWRLPTYIELLSIVDYESSEPSINEIAFIDTNLGNYWSSTPFANAANSVWVVRFSLGTTGPILDTSSFLSTRCVR